MINNQLEKGKKTWVELHAQPRFRPQYPNDAVIRWAFGTLKARDNLKISILDIG